MRDISGSGAVQPWRRVDSYTIVACLLFLATMIAEWRDYVRKHEAIYLLGSRRIFDPEFLSRDLSWAEPPPTTFLFDHGLAPLWAWFGDFGIVSIGRVLTWLLLAWSLSMLARNMRLPPWSMVVGFTLWILGDQTIAACGSPFDGFQPKSFAYPLVYFALAFTIRGAMIPAGIAAGLATGFHIIIGGWGCVALTFSMLINRQVFPLRDVGGFVLTAGLLILPLLIAVGIFHSGGMDSSAQALMDKIYVTFAEPHCVDPTYFLTEPVLWRVIAVLPLSVLLLLYWPVQPASRIVAAFVFILVVLFGIGLLASEFRLNWLLKLYPFQLANSIPAIFLFVMSLAFFSAYRPRKILSGAIWILGLLVSGWMSYDQDVLTDRLLAVPQGFLESGHWEDPVLYGREISPERLAMYAWIRENTSADSIFITPYLPEFWTYAERAQVASFRHSPTDHRLIEWKKRLEALNGFQPFEHRGFDIEDELSDHESSLTLWQLAALAQNYGATYYLAIGVRSDLPDHLMYSNGEYSIYRVDSIARSPVR